MWQCQQQSKDSTANTYIWTLRGSVYYICLLLEFMLSDIFVAKNINMTLIQGVMIHLPMWMLRLIFVETWIQLDAMCSNFF
jgi:hypothetical protein